ncbi:hypothetical protein F5B22DRAFT_651977 [Xylaria bambusicola]|uniref:uncharacterized protein n=1 Tax=Xylaria bambusicola TaxID=326684 RepID=UPI002008B1B1|nr:uncharacterized protein F5B22DRAFT_651977 [Xylaria bambusicola]KAI0505236.1 hypothetical protein F5B22DRAFT_651977 [Xylaria bambusicola]
MYGKVRVLLSYNTHFVDVGNVDVDGVRGDQFSHKRTHQVNSDQEGPSQYFQTLSIKAFYNTLQVFKNSTRKNTIICYHNKAFSNTLIQPPKPTMNISICPHPDPVAVAAIEREVFSNYQFNVMTSILGVVVVFWLCTSVFFIYHFYKSNRANATRRRFNEDQGIELRSGVNSVRIQDEFVFWADNYRRRQQQAQQQRAQQQQGQQSQQNRETQQAQPQVEAQDS